MFHLLEIADILRTRARRQKKLKYHGNAIGRICGRSSKPFAGKTMHGISAFARVSHEAMTSEPKETNPRRNGRGRPELWLPLPRGRGRTCGNSRGELPILSEDLGSVEDRLKTDLSIAVETEVLHFFLYSW